MAERQPVDVPVSVIQSCIGRCSEGDILRVIELIVLRNKRIACWLPREMRRGLIDGGSTVRRPVANRTRQPWHGLVGGADDSADVAL